jgi:hypothetical protein
LWYHFHYFHLLFIHKFLLLSWRTILNSRFSFQDFSAFYFLRGFSVVGDDVECGGRMKESNVSYENTITIHIETSSFHDYINSSFCVMLLLVSSLIYIFCLSRYLGRNKLKSYWFNGPRISLAVNKKSCFPPVPHPRHRLLLKCSNRLHSSQFHLKSGAGGCEENYVFNVFFFWIYHNMFSFSRIFFLFLVLYMVPLFTFAARVYSTIPLRIKMIWTSMWMSGRKCGGKSKTNPFSSTTARFVFAGMKRASIHTFWGTLTC